MASLHRILAVKYDDQRGPYLSLDFNQAHGNDELFSRYAAALRGTKIDYAQLLSAGLFDDSNHPLFEYRSAHSSSFNQLPIDCVMTLAAIITTNPCAVVSDYLRYSKGILLCLIN